MGNQKSSTFFISIIIWCNDNKNEIKISENNCGSDGRNLIRRIIDWLINQLFLGGDSIDNFAACVFAKRPQIGNFGGATHLFAGRKVWKEGQVCDKTGRRKGNQFFQAFFVYIIFSMEGIVMSSKRWCFRPTRPNSRSDKPTTWCLCIDWAKPGTRKKWFVTSLRKTHRSPRWFGPTRRVLLSDC